jgi:hypothetical protein
MGEEVLFGGKTRAKNLVRLSLKRKNSSKKTTTDAYFYHVVA